MSVIVSGMEMPEHCGYCRFRYDGICHALQKTQYSMEECPLVPVPLHGRLIDADAIEHDGWTASRTYQASPTESVYETRHMNEFPTIIEAEEVESDA